ncbi:MAG: hypothetical protein ACJ788_27160 [Ktedonobacteraceae bacterium]
MDYTAGPGRRAIGQGSPEVSQPTPANSIRARAHVASGGNVGMNNNASTLHILLFERDQQLMGLLTSELQQAGLECHTARTAVEVFDAIARYPIRMVLVNLAQAATARREFWVALDTQRRGRGIQVFTFHCTNLAGYGPASNDEEERSYAVMADLEVDGMTGVMNLVNAVRSRLAAANTGAPSRGSNSSASAPTMGSQVTTPAPSIPAQNASQSIRGTIPLSPAQTPQTSGPGEAQRPNGANYTDKIRAVIYPNQRPWNSSAARDNSIGSSQHAPAREQQQPGQEAQRSGRSAQNADMPTATTTPEPMNAAPAMVDTPANTNSQARRPPSDAGMPKESSLAQLSRMLQEQQSPTLEELAQHSNDESSDTLQEETMLHQRVRRANDTPISSIPLRASPIQDMPVERGSGGQSDLAAHMNTRRYEELASAQYTPTPPSPPLASLGMSPAPAPLSTPTQTQAPTSFRGTPAHSPVMQTQASPKEEGNQFAVPVVESSPAYHAPYLAPEASEREEQYPDEPVEELGSSYSEYENSIAPDQQATIALPTTPRAPDNELLLDIMESLPPMASPPPQPQAHNGRATRSLGSVLLEGHLVPQNRLQVAQSIQRMLSGVDMNYQLGEILLIFKLLTPDQLLAASLVSYGLITTTQISALGRIRQELHAIGLEYDLESLLILFRILTSEQLREVRAGWSG